MTRAQLEHLLRAAAAITGTDRFVVIGSQAVWAHTDRPPPELVESIEADLFTFRSAEDAGLVEGSIGEGSPFHTTFGYFAHGVGEETAVLPPGWKDRLLSVRTPGMGGATGLFLEVHDLAVSKLIAGRAKDQDYVAGLLRHHLADPKTVSTRLAATQLDPQRRTAAESRLARLVAAL